MCWQDYLERSVTAMGVTIAASVYVFLFATAIFYVPLPPSLGVPMRQQSFPFASTMLLRGSSNTILSSSTKANDYDNMERPFFTPFQSSEELRSAVDLWLEDENEALDQYGPMEDWNVSLVDNMASLFEGAVGFDADLSRWDVQNVKNMSSMFKGTKNFRGKKSLVEWNTSQVIDFSHMFEESNFDGDLSTWQTRSGNDFSYMFRKAKYFRGNYLSGWIFGDNVTTMQSMFEDATSFQSDLSVWIIPRTTKTTNMFKGASSFDAIHKAPKSSAFNVFAAITDVIPPVNNFMDRPEELSFGGAASLLLSSSDDEKDDDYDSMEDEEHWRRFKTDERVDDVHGQTDHDFVSESTLDQESTMIGMSTALYFGLISYGLLLAALIAPRFLPKRMRMRQ